MIPGIMTPPPLRRETGASYVGGQRNFGTSSTISTLGGAVGDLLILYDPAGSATKSLSSGNALTDITSNFHTRVLNSDDIAGTVTVSAGGGSCVIYRGAASAAVVLSDSDNGSSIDAGGFTKNASHAGIVGMIQSSTGSATLSIAAPPVFANRLSGATSAVAASTILFADRLQPVNVTYINSASIVWNTTAAASLRILELRS